VALPAYPVLIRGRFDPYRWAQEPGRRSALFLANGRAAGNGHSESDSAVIRGFPGAAGVVEVFVRRLDRPVEGQALQAGEILVTGSTNIGWTPLFPRAAAIITDVSAPLFHAAIVARELDTPAVVGSGNATRRLRTGDIVRVDGSGGTVENLATADADAAA
jgi:rifampicin phosphotransferase